MDPENAGADEEDPQSWNGYAYARNNPLLYVDPDGRRYQICEPGGKNCVYVNNDRDWEQYVAKSDLIVAKGNVYAKNKDGSVGALIGTVTWSPGLDFSSVQILSRVERQAGPPVRALAAGTIGFVAGAGAAGIVGTLSGASLSTLGPLAPPITVSLGNLRHIAKHLDEFRKIDPSMTLQDLVQLGQRIAGQAANLIGTPGGRRVYEKVVQIGGKPVTVRAVLNTKGGLRSVQVR